MFTVGTLVIGNENNHYGITNKNSLCIVAKVYDAHGMSVIVLETNYFSLKSKLFSLDEIVTMDENLSFRRSNSEIGCFVVDPDCFKEITLEEYREFIDSNDITTVKNLSYNNFLTYYTTKGGKTMTTMETTTTIESAPIISLESGKYNFTEEDKERVNNLAIKGVYEPFDWDWTQEGLNKIWNVYKENKAGLAYILSQSKYWDAKNLAIVMKANFERSRDNKIIKNFRKWILEQSKNYASEHQFKSYCSTYDELKEMYYRLDSLTDKMYALIQTGSTWYTTAHHNITFDGMTYDEVRAERNRIKEAMEELKCKSYPYDYYRVSEETYNLLDGIENFIDSVVEFEENIANEEFANNANNIADRIFVRYNSKGKVIPFGATKGQKVSRIVGKFFKLAGFDKIVDMQTKTWYDDAGTFHSKEVDMGWNRRFTEFSDAINPLQYENTVVISVNPVDYLTMSFGNSWASCHTPDKTNKRHGAGNYSGCYCSGTLSYMLDEPSLIMYTVKDNTDKEYCLRDKLKRCVFYIGEDKIVQSRIYPDGRDEDCETEIAVQFRAIMQRVISECVDTNNLWTIEKGRRACERVIETNSGATNYEDYAHYNDCNVSYLKKTGEEKNKKMIYVGHAPICPCCGEEHDSEEWLTCEDCRDESGDYVYCERCGERIYIDDAIYDEDTGHYYCDSECAEWRDCYWCENVGEYHSESVYYDNYTGTYFYDPDEEYVCTHDGNMYMNSDNAEADGYVYVNSVEQWYRDDSEEIAQCPHCGEIYLIEDAEDGTCPECGCILNEDEIDEDEIDEAM